MTKGAEKQNYISKTIEIDFCIQKLSSEVQKIDFRSRNHSSEIQKVIFRDRNHSFEMRKVVFRTKESHNVPPLKRNHIKNIRA